MAANEKQQKIKDTMVFQAMKHNAKPEVVSALVKGMQHADPAEVIASAASTTLHAVMLAAKESGVDADKRYILPVGKEVVSDLADTLAEIGVIDPKEAPPLAMSAFKQFAEIVGAGSPDQAKPAGMLSAGG